MNEINRLQLKQLIKYILLEASLGSNLEISGNVIRCANCGAPADRKNARCAYCGIAHNWKLFDEEIAHTKQVELAKSRGGGIGAASGAGIAVGAAASGFNGGASVPPATDAKSPAGAPAGASQASKPTNVKIKKFGNLLKMRFPNENTGELGGVANALAFVFKDKYGSLYDQIIKNEYETSQENQIVKQILSFRDRYIIKVLDSVSSNPVNFPRNGIDSIVKAVEGKYFLSSDFYKKQVLGVPNADIIKPFFPSDESGNVNEGKLYALAGLLSNRDKYLKALNNLDYDSLEMATFAENVARRITKKLLSGIK